MKQFNTILVAVDFSTYSKAATKYAFDMAREFGATPVFIHVVKQRDLSLIRSVLEKALMGGNAVTPLSELIEGIHSEKQEKLESFISSLNREKIEYKSEIRTGVPHQEILKAISDYEADLVLMGVKGKSNLSDSITGSTAVKMFRRCPVPLVTVREYKP